MASQTRLAIWAMRTIPWGDYRQLIDYYQQSMVIKREIGDRKGIAISLFNLANTYAKIDEHWKAREGYEQAKAIFTELKLAHRE